MALATLAANLVLVRQELQAAATATPSRLDPQRTPSPGADAAGRVLDRSLDLEVRVVALKELSASAADPSPLLRILRRAKAESPAEVQIRAMTITALGRFPEAPAAREVLVVLAFTRSAERSERVLALDVLARRPDLEQCRKPLTSLSQDPEPLVSARAKQILAGLSPPPR